MVAHFNLMQSFYRGLSEGNLYPGWQAETNRGYGAPATIFYPPGIYYLTSAIYVFARDWFTTIRVAYLILMIGAGMSFYALARSTLPRAASIIAMIAYQVAPYHLLNHYQRGALAECLGLIWLPIVLLFALDRQYSTRVRFVGMAISSGLFLWSHPPTAFQTALVFGPLIAIPDIRAREWKRLLTAVFGIGAGTLLASAYLLPAFVEQRLIHSQDIATTWPYVESYVFDYASKRYNHVLDDFIVRIDYIWLLEALQIVAVSVWVIVFRVRAAWLWVAGGGISLFLMTKLSSPLNSIIPGIAIGVFSWRLLAIVSLCAAMLAGVSYTPIASRVRQQSRPFKLSGLAISLAILSSCLVFSAVQVVRPMYRAQALSPTPRHSHVSLIPIGAFDDAVDVPFMRLVSGSGDFEVTKWDSEQRRASMNVREPGTVSVRTYFFPGWTAVAGSSVLNTRAGIDGEILVDVPAGRYDLSLEFRPTPVRWLGRALSSAVLVLAFAAVILILVQTRKRKPQSAFLTT